MSDTAIIIPARLESKRFPGKLLIDLNGKTLIERVYDKCVASGLPTYVATDSEEIARLFPFNVIKTSSKHSNGTERIAEVAENLKYSAYINVQGDFIGVDNDIIKYHTLVPYGKLRTSVVALHKDEINDPDVVKVIHTGSIAHWFTRMPVPYASKHLGIYSYSSDLLQAYKFAGESPAETTEKLEQLRWFTMHLKDDPYMRVNLHDRRSDRVYSIDNPADIEKWKRQNPQ